MAHDFAKKSTRKQSATKGRRKSKAVVETPSSFSWSWFLLALALSALVIILVMLKLHHDKHPSHTKNTISKHQQHTKKQSKQNVPRFDFYTLLPKTKVWLPKQSNKKSQQSAKHYAYVLQVASFKQYQDADKMKAKLSLAGYNVTIKTNQDSHGQWNRVWVGPFQSEQNAFETQENLAKQNITGLIVKIPK